MSQQLSSTLADLSVQLGTLRFPLDRLCGGLLVCGMTGSGKTVSVVNPLAQQFAALKSKQQARKPAIVYFSLKGRPHEQFLAGLPKERRADVVTISHESSVWVSLFNRANWRSEAELNGAVVRFVDEFSQHLSDEMTTQRHDVFWERQRLRYAKTLLGLQVKYSPLISLSPAIRDLNSEDGLKTLLARMEVFFEYATSMSPEQVRIFGVNRDENPQPEDEDWAKREFAKVLPDQGDWPANPRLAEGLTKLLVQLGKPAAFDPSKTKLGVFQAALTEESKAQLNGLVIEFFRLADATKYSILADVRGVLDTFQNAETSRYLLGTGTNQLTLEEVIHEGKILIVDLPLADGGNSSYPTLLALKLALFGRLLGRNSALHNGQPLCRRPVCVVIDEFQNLVTKGRTGGEDLMLAQCREHGVTVMLASQSLSLLSGVMQNNAKLSALVANCRNKIFGRNGDTLTNQLASFACGKRELEGVQRSPVWHGGEAFRAFVTDTVANEAPVVQEGRFGSLQTGQFFAATADGGTYWLDLRHSLAAPEVKTMRPPLG